jgi:hypothetical protein
MTNEELDCARVEEAWNKYNTGHTYDTVELIAARLAREGWTPPEVVDLDEKWAHQCTKELFDPLQTVNLDRAYDYFLAAIKKGRELERAEAKPKGPQTAALQAGSAGYRDWHDITHHAIIAPPAEDAA